MTDPIPILLVEDRNEDAALTLHALKRGAIDSRVDRVENEAAFRRGLASRPAIILSDFSLPAFDGLQALAIARDVAPEIPFIFVSGTIGEERAIEALKLGATDYVLKTNLKRLAPAVLRALEDARARQATRRAESRFRDLVQTSQDWIWELDADRRYSFASESVGDMLGVPPDQIVGAYHTDHMHEDDALVLDAAISELVDGRSPSLSVIARWRHADGSTRWLERRALPVIGDDGRIAGYRGADRDVTQRRSHEARIERLNRIHTMLSSINTAVLRIRDQPELLHEICRIAASQGGYATVGILMVEAGSAIARTVAIEGANAAYYRDFSVPLRADATSFSSLTEEVLATGRPVVCNDLMDPAHSVFGREQSALAGMRAISVWPMSVDGTVVGAICFHSDEADAFDADETNVLGQVAGSLSFALQYIEKDGQAKYLTYFDPMTGLARRPLFCERLARTLLKTDQDGRSTTVFVVDVEHLSGINDQLGRHCGDHLLQLLAERLKGIAADPSDLGYFGNGSFAVRFSLDSSAAGLAAPLATELQRLASRPFSVEGHELDVTFRIGVAQYPRDHVLAEGLVHDAELALKSAKSSGTRVVEYAPDLNADLLHRMNLEHRLRRALAERQFEIHYQPKIECLDGKIIGVEALLRWRDPEQGLRSPAEFIPVLEESGLIVDVGYWVIEQAVTDATEWFAQGLPSMPIAVNVSALQLCRADFVDTFLRLMSPLTAIHEHLDIEITESALMDNLEVAATALRRLRDAGVRVAIDDFGTGYSSLSRLMRVPVDCLKIDRTFVTRLDSTPGNQAIVSTVVALAGSLNLTPIAEGVETAAELRELQRLGCPQIQGYLAARPMPARKLRAFALAAAGGLAALRSAGGSSRAPPRALEGS